MKKPLKIKDNNENKDVDPSEYPSLNEHIVGKSLSELEHEGVFVFPDVINNSEDLEEEQTILEIKNNCYTTGNVMGFIGCEDEQLYITSRFSEEYKDYFFQYILEKAMDFPNFVDLKVEEKEEPKLYDFLMFLFPYCLKEAMRKGIFKKYIRKEYNDQNLKGTIDIARHIRQNTPFIGNIAYNRREFSYDNSLTELIRHTVEFIRGKRYGGRILTKVRDEVNLVISATPGYRACDRQKIINENKKIVITHAYFREYRILQKLCLQILSQHKYQTGTGKRKIYGFLFDGAWLWERYVNYLIGVKFYHPNNKTRTDTQYLFEKGAGPIYPDFISRNTDNRVIADAKYKPIENIKNHDYLQLLAYMFRFDAKTGYYLYPETEESKDPKFYLNRGSSFEKNVSPRDDIYVMKHGLEIPKEVSGYDEFVQKITSAEQKFTEELLHTSEA